MAQKVSQPEIDLLKVQIKPVLKNANDISYDWSGLQKVINTKRIVLLGEFTHGSREISNAKSELIAYLQKNMAFDVVLFEAGIGEIGTIELKKDSLTAAEMTYGFYSNGRSKGKAKLMGYLKDEGLDFAGFDVQSSGNGFYEILFEVLGELSIEISNYDTIETDFSNVDRLLQSKVIPKDSVINRAKTLLETYSVLQKKIHVVKGSAESWKISLVQQTLTNRAAYLNYRIRFLQTNNWTERWKARDSMMARNVKWLLNNRFKKNKVIILGHNFHIAKYNEKETVMGEYLYDTFGSEMYTLGMFAKQGVYADNSGRPVLLKKTDENELDIKDIIALSNSEVSFLQIPKKTGTAYRWAHEKIITNDTFVDLYNSKTQVLQKCYDGLLLFKNNSPPIKLTK